MVPGEKDSLTGHVVASPGSVLVTVTAQAGSNTLAWFTSVKKVSSCWSCPSNLFFIHFLNISTLSAKAKQLQTTLDMETLFKGILPKGGRIA
jgi:predicted ribosomally synthesized peptide with SipW-like signal peptide